MTFMRQLSPAMDDMFMDSLRWVDHTYMRKHSSEDPATLRAMYYPSLTMYTKKKSGAERSKREGAWRLAQTFARRYGRKAALSLAVYLCTFIPYVGRFVLPAVSCYTFNQAVGPQPAALAFASTLFLPRKYLVRFLQSYYSSRNLMRELVSEEIHDLMSNEQELTVPL